MVINKKSISVALLLGFFLIGCGQNNQIEEKTNSIAMVDGFNYKVINNKDQAIKTTYKDYEIKVLSNSPEKAEPQSRHKGLVVKINGEKTKTLHLQDSYLGKEIIIGVYKDNQLVKVSNVITIEDKPVTIANMQL